MKSQKRRRERGKRGEGKKGRNRRARLQIIPLMQLSETRINRLSERKRFGEKQKKLTPWLAFFLRSPLFKGRLLNLSLV
jgi:hypothetical protein